MSLLKLFRKFAQVSFTESTGDLSHSINIPTVLHLIFNGNTFLHHPKPRTTEHLFKMSYVPKNDDFAFIHFNINFKIV